MSFLLMWYSIGILFLFDYQSFFRTWIVKSLLRSNVYTLDKAWDKNILTDSIKVMISYVANDIIFIQQKLVVITMGVIEIFNKVNPYFMSMI